MVVRALSGRTGIYIKDGDTMKNDKISIWRILDVSNTGMSIGVWSAIACAIVTAFLTILSIDRDLYMKLAEEGTNTERLTSIFYLVAGVLFLILGWRNYRQSHSFETLLFPLLFGLFFLFIAGEEESWGQWLFYYDTPAAFKDMNTQQEVNIHNLSLFASLLSPHTVLNLVALLIGVLIPLGYRFIAPLRRLANVIHFPVSPLACITLFVLGLLYERASGMIYHQWANAEIREFIFSLGVLLFAISAYWRRNRLE